VVASGAAPPGLVGEGQVTVHRATTTLHQNIIVLSMTKRGLYGRSKYLQLISIPIQKPQAAILTQKKASENRFFTFFFSI
jgi:hypothetical protein